VLAQELTPRTFWPAPKGTKLVFLTYAHSSGDILPDPSLPVTGVDSDIDTVVLTYQQTLSIAGRTANLRLELPYEDAYTSGEVEGEFVSRSVNGIGDFKVTLSYNLLGAPSMNVEEFQALRKNPRPVLGMSLKVLAPTGQYDADRLVNIGSNRWATRIRLGYIQPLPSRWMIELGLGTWFFQDNDEFVVGTREQDPITAIDINVIHRFGPGFWMSLDANYYFGGRTTVDGVGRADFQRNSRAGITFAYPFARVHAVRAAYSIGLITDAGNDFRTLMLTYAFLFR